jgi:hypothetical protein
MALRKITFSPFLALNTTEQITTVFISRQIQICMRWNHVDIHYGLGFRTRGSLRENAPQISKKKIKQKNKEM